MTTPKPARIVTFYSYKGGTGRSMALANIAWILASNSKRVLVVDWDLEAPGLQRYFRPFLIDRELVSSPGIVDLITSFILEAVTPVEQGQTLPADWFMPLTDIDPYIISLDWKFPKGGKIDFIPAGRQGPDYAMRFSAINWQKFYDVLGGGAFIEELKVKMRSGYDYVLVDSRTGISDTSGICTIQLPDSLVVCFTFNNQSVDGAAAITQGVCDQRLTQDSKSLSSTSGNQSPNNGSSGAAYKHPYHFRVFPVPMRVDQAEKDKLELRQFYTRWKFDPFMERIPAAERRGYWGSVEVPYVPFFAYEEILAPFKEDPADPKTCLAAFTRIAVEITQQEVKGFTLLMSPEQNYAVLQEFASLPPALLASQTGDTARGGLNVAESKTITTQTESDLEKALRLAETTLQSLAPEQRDMARLMWMRLVRIPAPGENIANSKVRVHMDDLPQDAKPIVNAFAAAGLLTITHELGDTTIEVANEELLRNWPTLNAWLKADRDLMIWRQDLQTNKARWLERRRLPAYLLTGRALFEAKEWHTTHRKYLSDSEAEYIEASIDENVKYQKRERRNQLWRAAAAVAIVLALVGFYFYSYSRTNSSSRANELAAIAQQKIDAANSGNQSDQLQLGILLAVESERLARNDRAENILKSKLPLLPRRGTSFEVGRNVLGIAINPDGTRLLSVTGRPTLGQNIYEDRIAQLFDLSAADPMRNVPTMQFKPGSRGFRLSPDARYLAVVISENGTYSVNVYDTANMESISTIRYRAPVYDMAFSPDGLYFAMASENHAAVLDLTAAAKRNESGPVILRSPGTLNAVTFSGDSRKLAVAGENFQVQVWQVTPGQSSWGDPREIPVGGTAFILAISQTGNYLATVSLNNTLIDVWDVQSGKKIVTLDNRPDAVKVVSFTSDDRYLLTAGIRPAIGVWSLDDKKQEPALRAQGDVSQLSFSPDGEYLTAVAANAPAQLWQYGNGTFNEAGFLISPFNLTNLAFGAPHRVVTAGADNVVRIWDVGIGVSTDLSTEACLRLTRNLKVDEWDTYLANYLGRYRLTCSEIR